MQPYTLVIRDPEGDLQLVNLGTHSSEGSALDWYMDHTHDYSLDTPVGIAATEPGHAPRYLSEIVVPPWRRWVITDGLAS